MTDRAEIMHALADPTRQCIVELLATTDRSAGELAECFEVSRPAVSRHLRVLREAGVVTSRAEVRHRIYTLEPIALDRVTDWLDRTRHAWEARLDALEAELRRGRDG